jgi:LytS/YehU family sensor histidine kinase
VSTRELSPIDILLEIKEEEVHLKVRNNKQSQATLQPLENTGIGIQNTRRRLELLYPDRYSLEMTDEPATYTVNLNIQV